MAAGAAELQTTAARLIARRASDIFHDIAGIRNLVLVILLKPQLQGANRMDSYEERVRRKAHGLWEQEGRPEGREGTHWDRARELVRIEDNEMVTTNPIQVPISRTDELVEQIGTPGETGDFQITTDGSEAQSDLRAPLETDMAESYSATDVRAAAIDAMVRPLAAFAIDAIKLAIIERLQYYARAMRRRPPPV